MQNQEPASGPDRVLTYRPSRDRSLPNAGLPPACGRYWLASANEAPQADLIRKLADRRLRLDRYCLGRIARVAPHRRRGQSLDSLENFTVDWRFSLVGEQPPPRGVVIVAIDDETLREIGGYPPPRDVLARIVRRLAANGPQA